MAYTLTAFTPSGGDASRVGRPEGKTSGPLLVYCHGAGGDETEFDNSDYDALKSWMLGAGWAWVESNATGAGWGNAASCTHYRAAYDHAVANYWTPTDVVLFGRSMGGLASSWLYTQDPVLSGAKGLILCSAVQSLMWMYDYSSGTSFAAGIRTAYGTTTRDGTVAATLGKDPIRFSPSLYTGKSVLFQSADADTIVDGQANVFAQQFRVGSGLKTNQTHTMVGDHYVTRPRASEHVRFMDKVAPERVVYTATKKYVYTNGRKYLLDGS